MSWDGAPSGQMLRMQKDANGLWSTTTEPIHPDIYGYAFVVDGVRLADPNNPLSKPVLPAGSHSLLHVPGPASLSWEITDVPRGVLHHHFYRSAIVGDWRDFYVYTPPGYDPASASRYPVLYLLHGLSDDASGWTAAGRAHVILDNLIAQGKAKPMVMVNTLGYGLPASTGFAGMIDPKGQRNFGRALLEEVLPQVERAYRVSADPTSRAIAGLSMGGTQALSIGLNNADRFAWIATFSGAFSMFSEAPRGPGPPKPPEPAELADAFPSLDPETVNSRVRLLWIRCGKEDFLLETNRRTREWLTGKKVRFSYEETPGAHTWMVWRRNLIELVPLLFQSGSR